jgi:NAD(P)-dependent dehydrogenase (short-subunit alcohol dehydrogenase family)
MANALDKKSILITGGSTGIGKATVLRCAEEGALVTLADINTEEAEQVVAQVNDAGGSAVFCRADVTQSEDVKQMIEMATSTYGRLDGAFNNAGIEGAFTSITKMTEVEYDRTVNVDMKGVWLCLKYQIETFLTQGSPGSIVSTASVAGLVGTRGGSAYCGAKHGVVGMTKSVALECARKAIRVNAVCPGVIQTPMVDRMTTEAGISAQALVDQEPMERLGLPKEIAEAVVWLLSEQSSFVTGIAMPVDGGYTAV